MKIVIDAGHGNATAGKRSPDGTLREYHFNSVVANYVKQGLADYQCEVIFTHADDRDVPLNQRVAKANINKADVFISIHANAYGTSFNDANGTETFVYKLSLKDAVALATTINNGIVKIKGQKNRGVKAGNFQVLRETNMTAILIEAGFMTNAKELSYLKSDEYRRSVAKVIVEALVSTYKLKNKTVVPTPSSTNKTQYRVICGVYESKENAAARVEYLKKVGLGAFVEEKDK